MVDLLTELSFLVLTLEIMAFPMLVKMPKEDVYEENMLFGWMNSEGHRAAILHTNHSQRHIGIGGTPSLTEGMGSAITKFS